MHASILRACNIQNYIYFTTHARCGHLYMQELSTYSQYIQFPTHALYTKNTFSIIESNSKLLNLSNSQQKNVLELVRKYSMDNSCRKVIFYLYLYFLFRIYYHHSEKLNFYYLIKWSFILIIRN